MLLSLLQAQKTYNAMSEKLQNIKSMVFAAFLGGLVYSIIMSMFYQFFNEEPFNAKKFIVDFTMFAVIMGLVSWWNLKKKNKKS
jgi:Co/Zn/Cd efflux system component